MSDNSATLLLIKLVWMTRPSRSAAPVDAGGAH